MKAHELKPITAKKRQSGVWTPERRTAASERMKATMKRRHGK